MRNTRKATSELPTTEWDSRSQNSEFSKTICGLDVLETVFEQTKNKMKFRQKVDQTDFDCNLWFFDTCMTF